MKNTLLISIFLYFLLQSNVIDGQTTKNFTPENEFPIEINNSTIRFAIDGNYSQANQNNGIWIFRDLYLTDSAYWFPILEISIRECNITVLSFRRFAAAQNAGIFSYNVSGEGTQSFNFNLEPKEREWSAVLDDAFLPEGQGWRVSDDETITVFKKATNVTLFYLDYPSDLIENRNLPFCQRHSIVISTVIILVITIIAAFIIQLRSKTRLEIINESTVI